MKRLRNLSNIFALLIILLSAQGVISYSCLTAMNNNWMTSNDWARCYESSNQHIIGHTVGSLSAASYWGQTASWDYDYNNYITFLYQTTVTQRWGYRNHNSYTCNSNCPCSGTNECINQFCSDQSCNCDDCYHDYWPYSHYYCNCQCCTYGYTVKYDWYNDYSIDTASYRPCHFYCQACTARWNKNACSSCRQTRTGGGAAVYGYKWNNFPDRTYTRCDSYCPNDANERNHDNLYTGQYIVSTSNRVCGTCNTWCSVCADFQGGAQCSVCVNPAGLINNNAACLLQYPDNSDNQYCKTDSQCLNPCPTELYFYSAKSRYSNAAYPFQYNVAAHQHTGVCYLCHRYCQQCTDQYDNSCSVCAYNYYKWVQYSNRCNYYCIEGQYTAGGIKGEYYNPIAPTTLTNRTCAVCDAGCQYCANYNYQCYKCQDNYYLLDDHLQCKSRFTCKQCINSSIITSVNSGCYSRNKYCRPTDCPVYFYFKVLRVSADADYQSYNNKYNFFTQNQTVDSYLNKYERSTTRSGNSSLQSPTVTAGRGTTNAYYYRKDTNFCKLCDYRCMKCYGPTNFQCTQCVNLFYLYTDSHTCQNICPLSQFKQDLLTHLYPDNETKCGNCDPYCIACTGYYNNCSSCRPFINVTYYSFLHTYVIYNSSCLRSCPVSTSPLTQKGYYGSISTMICYACPGFCSDCNIATTMNTATFPQLQNINCGTDYLCSKGINCTACLTGYSLVSGKCIAQESCRLYSYYLRGDSSSAWSPTNCVCLEGYYFSQTIWCSLCSLSCKTCSIISTNCTSCYQGYALSSGTCSSTNSGSQIYYTNSWSSGNSFSSYITRTPTTQTKTCGIYTNTLFGYRAAYTTTSYIRFSTFNQITAQNYYAISIKMQVLFIDNWDVNAGLYFYLNGNSQPSHIYTYNNFGAVGEQQCGTNANDYLLNIYAKIDVTGTVNTQHYIDVRPNFNPVQNNSGFFYYLGFNAAMFSVLRCHSDCKTCTGPSASQCLSCNDVYKIIFNNTCVCNTAASGGGYYYIANTQNCQNGCPTCNSATNANACYYRDTVTRQCVNPPIKNCSAPYIYGDNYDLTNSYGTCVTTCGTKYAIPSLMKCTSNCGTFGLYFYDGGINSKTCVSACPQGLMINPVNRMCVNVCPIISTVYYYLLLQNRTTNPLCASKCTSGYQFKNLNECVQRCPSGYYTQTLNVTINSVTSLHNQCVQRCSSAYGDNLTQSCVNFCPSPSIADPTNNLCVNQCPTMQGYYLQVSITNGNRTCVTQCQAGQWLHPFNLNCSKNPMDCPVGTFADNSTKKCQFKCLTYGQVGETSTRMCQTSCNTGFAYWDAGLCVTICNNSNFGIIYGSQRQCVLSCNTNVTNMYADIQANRTCVRKCSSFPESTFGDVLTGNCTKLCTGSTYYGDPKHENRLCVQTCTFSPNQTFSYQLTKLCVQVCPQGYYGDNYTIISKGVCATGCPNGYYGDPISNLCVTKCPYLYYGSPTSGRPCLTTCLVGYYSMNLTSNRICHNICDEGFWADNYTRACYNIKTKCSQQTYADPQKRWCVIGTSCSATPIATYADPMTMGCQNRCTNSSYFGDPSTNLCVTLCPANPDYYSQNGYCTSACTGGWFADPQFNRTCLQLCSNSPLPLFGNSLFRCVNASNCGNNLFGNNNTRLCSSCSGTLPFGDPITFYCVINCSSTYYGDLNTNKCVQNCSTTIPQYADNATGQCTTLCTLGTFGVNSTTKPICQQQCPSLSYALDSTRVCVSNCGSGFFGDPVTGKCLSNSMNCSNGYYGNTVSNLCVLPADCQTVGGLHYYADNTTKKCIQKCTSPNYGYNITYTCQLKCLEPLYAENNTRMCLSILGCKLYGSYADNQINMCVPRAECSIFPILTLSQNITNTCVIPQQCTNNMLAENISKTCVQFCPYNSTFISYADPYKSNYCVLKCPDLYYGDNSRGYGLCTSLCQGSNFFRDNVTQLCVYLCPTANTTLGTLDTYGDDTTDMCVIKCPNNYFAQIQLNRTCVLVCQSGTWGNSVTRMCITNPIIDCPSGTWADNFTNLCVSFCNTNSSNNQVFYGQNFTKLCIPSCPVPSFAYNPTRVCIDICPFTILDSPGYFGDPNATPTRLCVKVCITPGLYRDVANNRTCQQTCTYNNTIKTYRDPTKMTCVAQCSTYPQHLYAWASNSTNSICSVSCPTGHMYDNTMSCISVCPYLLDPTTNRCVDKCPYNSVSNTQLYADLNLLKCVTDNNCPNNTYASDDLSQCVLNCPNNTFIYLKKCVNICPDTFYINPISQACVTAPNCPNNYYANNQTKSCVIACKDGTYADINTRMCIQVCYGGKYGDSILGQCSSSCSAGLLKNNLTFTCVGQCSNGYFYDPSSSSCVTQCPSPYFANTNTTSCVQNCVSNPMTFASTTPKRACVTICPTSIPWFDLINRACVSTCPSNTYKYSLNQSCVSFCPQQFYLLSSNSSCVLNCSVGGNLFSNQLTKTCVSSCPNGFYADTSVYKCVVNCPLNPVRFYGINTTKSCVSNCPNNTYADDTVGICVFYCSDNPITYAQPNTNKCVKVCPLAYNSFADTTTNKCVTTCPSGYFTDLRQRKCLSYCGNTLYADSLTNPPSCVSYCTIYTFADPLTFKCSTSCSAQYFSYSVNRTCLQSCPYLYFSDHHSKYCVLQCRNSPYLYADNLTRNCSQSCTNDQYKHKISSEAFGKCVYICPNGYFSDPITMSCVQRCPNGYYGETTNNTCKTDCIESKFKDSVNNLCQTLCPQVNYLFGNPYTRSCVLNCISPVQTLLYADSRNRLCVFKCTNSQYADKINKVCVASGSCPSGTISDPHYGLCVNRCYDRTYAYNGVCVPTCPLITLFTNEETQSCVLAINCSSGLFGDPTKGKCVAFCDIASNRYRDLQSKMCLESCASPLWANNITRMCDTKCPSIPLYYGLNGSRICIQNCPNSTFGDPTLNLCVLRCSDGYFGNNNTWKCEQSCPYGTFGDNISSLCVRTCPRSPNYFGDIFTGTCVYNCSNGLFADTNNNRQCHTTCLSPYFSENSTLTCDLFCSTGFADSRTRQCIKNCSKGSYGYSFVCYINQCPSVSPSVYADDSTGLCVTICPSSTYGQPISRKCVPICPIANNQFADLINRVCVFNCGNKNSDPSTRTCVSVCPAVPSLYSYLGQCISECLYGFYADNYTRQCSSGCSNGTFADSTTYRCVQQCPSKPMRYAQNITYTCVSGCSIDHNRFADNISKSCVINCPNGTFADSITRSCKPVCSNGLFGINQTRKCETSCPANSFKNSLINLCVTKCPINPVFYGDPINKICLTQCPMNSFGNPLTQQCVYNNGSTSNCPDGYFADPTTSICVQKCPMKMNLYAEPFTKYCMSSCVSPYQADNSTMRCVLICPSYPSYFSDTTGKCVKFCPINTYADNSTRICKTNCPNGTYADNSTWKCVSLCTNFPYTLRDSLNWKCVSQCPLNYFSDLPNNLCVQQCPSLGEYYAFNTTFQCVKTCPNGTFAHKATKICVLQCYGNTFGDSISRKCVSVCPRSPPRFAYSVNMSCLASCPLSYYAYDNSRQCLTICNVTEGFYRQNSSASCVRQCNVLQNTYADNLTGFCVARCSVGVYADPTTKKCVSLCPNRPLMYADNDSQSCLSRCPGNLYGQNITRSCVTSCPNGSLSLPSSNLCVFECPIDFFAYKVTQFCLSQCQAPYYADPSTRSCVLSCPLSHLLFADNSTRRCVYNCPSGSYAFQWSVECMQSCPIAIPPFVQTYAASYDNTCVEQCAYPYYSYDVTHSCLSQCPNPYFSNIQNHQCELCPLSCSSCSTFTNCFTCQLNYYLQNGACNSACTAPYYANPNTRQCINSVSCRPLFGVNSTNTCQNSCANGQFANRNAYRCDACAPTCITCTSLSICISCISASVFHDNFCIGYCNITHPIFKFYNENNLTCTQNCPSGTYENLIYCLKCDSLCLTCRNTAHTCTNCTNGLYLLNNICQSFCPNLYKPLIDRTCFLCNNTCGAGLSFQTNVTQVNGQTSIFMNFNNAVNINGNIYDTISVNSNGGRLLQTGTSAYQIVIIDSQTVQIVFPPGTNNINYNIQIINPQNVIDNNGNIPQSTNVAVKLDGNNLYSTNIQNAPNQFPLYFTFLAIICVVSFIFDIQLMKFLQIIYVHYFVMINLPPIFTKTFIAIKYSTLYYLPRMFSVQTAVLRPQVPSSIFDTLGDYSFLRNAGFAFTPLVVIFLIWGLLKLLTLPEINKFKDFRILCIKLFEQKFKYAVILQWVSLFSLITIFFAFLQLRDYTIYDRFTQVSLILAHLIILLFAILLIVLIYRLIKFYFDHPKLSENLAKASDLVLNDHQSDKLTSSNIFLFEKKKIDLRNMFYPKINNENIFPFKCIYRLNIFALHSFNVTLLRAIIISAAIGLGQSVQLQMGVCIAINLLVLLYLVKARPYSFKFKHRRIKNYFAIYHEVCFIGLEILLLILGNKDKNGATSAQKELFSYYIIYYLASACTLTFAYHVFMIIVFIYRKFWLQFIESELFKRNFPKKYAEYQKSKNKGKKHIDKIDPMAKQALKNLIKGYKKHRSKLRPNEEDKLNPNLPAKYKITYFDKTENASMNSKTTLNRTQKKKMLKQIFENEIPSEKEDNYVNYEQMENSQTQEIAYEEYEEQIQIKASDLSRYIENAQELLKMKKNTLEQFN